MWLNDKQLSDSAISTYRKSLLNSCPSYIVIDDLFNTVKLDAVIRALQQDNYWQTQQHTYTALYVDNAQWQNTNDDQRFVQRDSWQYDGAHSNTASSNNISSEQDINTARDFLSYLRSDEFMSVLSRLFNVTLTDINVADPEVNSNYFRLGPDDFVEQHADDSPGREVCMLVYLNKEWDKNAGGELTFIGEGNSPIRIAPLYNRCVLFDPSSKGSEHWVEKLKSDFTDGSRYNVTSWYWSE